MKAESTPTEGQCLLCKEPNILVSLQCYHSCCVRCLTFSYHKHKLNMHRASQTRCPRCERSVDLG